MIPRHIYYFLRRRPAPEHYPPLFELVRQQTAPSEDEAFMRAGLDRADVVAFTGGYMKFDDPSRKRRMLAEWKRGDDTPEAAWADWRQEHPE